MQSVSAECVHGSQCGEEKGKIYCRPLPPVIRAFSFFFVCPGFRPAPFEVPVEDILILIA